MQCGECKGTGKLTLFTSVKPCRACGGSGEVADAPVPIYQSTIANDRQRIGGQYFDVQVPTITVANGNGGFTFNP